ncbi:MAG TPA: hypothetical protein VI775_00495 [Candidatus Paceibacterota bacterium]
MHEQIEQLMPEKEIRHVEVAELEMSSKKIIEQIQDRIEREEYGIIIGDDASGRIPTLIIGGLIRKVMKIEGKLVPNITFVPGKIDILLNPIDEFREFINKFGYKDGKKVLIITDTVLSGESLRTIIKCLRKMSIEVDVATIGLEDGLYYDDTHHAGSVMGVDLFSGGYVNVNNVGLKHTPRIYDNKDMSGVYKLENKAQSSRRLKDRVFDSSEGDRVQALIGEARKDVEILVDKLFKWYQEKYGEQK